MSTIRKKRLRLKKKNFTIFILSICLIIFIITKTTQTITNFINKSKEKETKEEIPKDKPKKEETEQEKKLKQLENIDKTLNYFKYDYIDRYISYKEKNKNLRIDEIIMHVNIGLDNEYYTNTQEASKLNEYNILVNKYNFLKDTYVPENLENVNLQYARKDMKLVNYAKDAYEKMAQAAKKEGYHLIITSAYRSYNYQEQLYNGYVKLDGQDNADTYSARAGFSEHKTGLAVDLYN